MKEVTGALLDFAQNTRYEDIPDEVIHEMKRILVDGLGSALGGLTSDKGKFGIGFARRVGGTPESTIIGICSFFSLHRQLIQQSPDSIRH